MCACFAPLFFCSGELGFHILAANRREFELCSTLDIARLRLSDTQYTQLLLCACQARARTRTRTRLRTRTPHTNSHPKPRTPHTNSHPKPNPNRTRSRIRTRMDPDRTAQSLHRAHASSVPISRGVRSTSAWALFPGEPADVLRLDYHRLRRSVWFDARDGAPLPP
eukprot:5856950-Prymnesium_polylepis.1